MVHAALLVILHLDLAQERHRLNTHERDLRARLKRKVIALAVVERARKKQSARISHIKEGDANTKFFHLRVNARRRKNFIQRLKHNNGWVTDHGTKEQVIHNHFRSIMHRGRARTVDFNWESIHFESPNMDSLGVPFTEEEVRNAINQMTSDKAPGPDGFTGIIFKKCWPIVKDDIMRAIGRFGELHVHGFRWLNSANIALLPKKDGLSMVAIIASIRAIILLRSALVAGSSSPITS
jgi:hypothetical protein